MKPFGYRPSGWPKDVPSTRATQPMPEQPEHEEARRLAKLERGIREEFYADRRELGDDEAVRHIVGAFARTQSLLAKAEQERDDLGHSLDTATEEWLEVANAWKTRALTAERELAGCTQALSDANRDYGKRLDEAEQERDNNQEYRDRYRTALNAAVQRETNVKRELERVRSELIEAKAKVLWLEASPSMQLYWTLRPSKWDEAVAALSTQEDE